MFTGIVEELGTITAIEVAGDGSSARLTVRGPIVTSDVAQGDSIAVNGICLTVVASAAETFTAELMAETLARTTAAAWAVGTPVNLERSVTAATRLGGHIVQGHVDGVGIVTSRVGADGYDDISVAVPLAVGRYLAPKGAVAVDGVSLTVIDVIDDAAAGPAGAASAGPAGAEPVTTFTLGIIPATRAATTLGGRLVGDTVNVEVDVMAKYAERLLAGRLADREPGPPTGPPAERRDARGTRRTDGSAQVEAG